MELDLSDIQSSSPTQIYMAFRCGTDTYLTSEEFVTSTWTNVNEVVSNGEVSVNLEYASRITINKETSDFLEVYVDYDDGETVTFELQPETDEDYDTLTIIEGRTENIL